MAPITREKLREEKGKIMEMSPGPQRDAAWDAWNQKTEDLNERTANDIPTFAGGYDPNFKYVPPVLVNDAVSEPEPQPEKPKPTQPQPEPVPVSTPSHPQQPLLSPSSWEVDMSGAPNLPVTPPTTPWTHFAVPPQPTLSASSQEVDMSGASDLPVKPPTTPWTPFAVPPQPLFCPVSHEVDMSGISNLPITPPTTPWTPSAALPQPVLWPVSYEVDMWWPWPPTPSSSQNASPVSALVSYPVFDYCGFSDDVFHQLMLMDEHVELGSYAYEDEEEMILHQSFGSSRIDPGDSQSRGHSKRALVAVACRRASRREQPLTEDYYIAQRLPFTLAYIFRFCLRGILSCTMQDPSNGISRELLPHVHLLSTYRFPLLPQLHPDKVAEWLLGAPKITRDQAPFYWTYLDRPADGTILLVWQTPALGNEFPSDGYIWPPQETAFQLEINGGYTLEMYAHKTGYAPGEPVAVHSRRRYRLLPSKFPNHNGPAPDISLWIVHYSQADPNDRLPINVIPIDMRVQNTLNTRAYLHSQGQIVQKEFMLSDRSNWPQIQFPRQQARGPPMYGGNVPPARMPQAMAYPTQHATAGPPAKRPRIQATPGQSAATNNPHAVLDVDDEEDTSRGDLFDHMTPREISLSRYKQNHEWMEEILSSPYAIHQIIPADLGLGVRGELASLTEDFFDAPLDPDKDVAKHNYVGRLDPDKADAFRKRATERIAETNNEIEKMKAKHAKRMAKFQRGSLVTHSEKELRTAVTDPSDMGSEYWRLEGKIEEDENGDKVVPRIPSKVDDILAQVEASLGRHAVAVQELRRIQDGGYEEAAPLPPTPPAIVSSPEKSGPQSGPQSAPRSMNGTPQSGVLVGDSDMDMGNSAAGMLDQYRTGLSSDATPGSNSYTPQATTLLQQHSASSTPSNLHVASPAPAQPKSAPADVNMSGAGEQAPSDPTGTGDWVVVPPGGVSPNPDAPSSAVPHSPAAVTTASEPSPLPAMTSTSTPQAPVASTSTPQPAIATSTEDNTPLPDFSTSPNDFADLGDLDSAGDALASYDGGDGLGDLGDLGDLDVGMDDSAFGDAFHGVEPRTEDGGDGL